MVSVAGEGHPDGGENGSTSEYAQADELSSDVEPDSDQCIESSSQAGSLSQISEPAEHKGRDGYYFRYNVHVLADESATPLAKVKLSNKLRMTNLVIEEGLGLCRVYNLVKENKDTANSLYKCMKCTNLSRTSAVKFSVHVSCFDGEVEETRGEHHSLCFPVPVAQIKAQEVDREQRTKLRKGFKTPRQAYEEVCRLVHFMK